MSSVTKFIHSLRCEQSGRRSVAYVASIGSCTNVEANGVCRLLSITGFLLGLAAVGMTIPGTTYGQQSDWQKGEFYWRVSPPVLQMDPDRLPPSPDYPWVSVKDPSIVHFDGRWHLFCTLRRKKTGDGRIHIGYCSFQNWSDAQQANWSVLDLTMGYHGAPQIFFFQPHQTWYLIYQAEDSRRGLKYGPCYSTNPNIADPQGWTRPQPLYVVKEGAKAGLDFWIICDEQKAHLFFTTLDGRMWRAETLIGHFPNQHWSEPKVVLKADIFEASHVYRVSDRNMYLAIIEAQDGKRRYFKAFQSESLAGDWTPLAATRQKPFVSVKNVINQATSWATSYSHGELIRKGYDQSLQIDSTNVRFLFQGANDAEYQIGGYGNIPWKLGILTMQ